MNKPFGMRAELQGFPWKDLAEEIEKDGILIKIANGIMDVGYDNEQDKEKAKRVAKLYIYAQSLRAGQKIKASFNHTWRTNASGDTDRDVSLGDQVSTSDRVQIQTLTHEVSITGRASIVTQEMHDSASFSNDTAMVSKALRDLTLEKALSYFSDEAINDDRPLYGIYKAIEVITKHLGGNGNQKLGQLVDQNEKYVSDVMQTTQIQRHAITFGRRKLSDDAYRQRAKNLIEAYANSLP